MWCKKIVLILLFILNLGESVPEDPATSTSKNVGDDSGISMPTNTQYVANNSKLAVTIANGTDIKLALAWGVPQHTVVCRVQCKKIDNVKDCRGQWMINSTTMPKELPNGITSITNVINNETTAAILQISNLGAVDGKKLYCVPEILFTSRNEFQIISSLYALATVTATGQPPIVEVKKEVKVKDGEDTQLDCMATGPVAPKVKWWKQSERTLKGFLIEGDIKVELDERFSYIKSDVIKGESSAKNSVIVITDVTYDDRSQFVCEAEYANRTVNTTFTLRVSDPLGVIWPLVGIVAEAILLVIIIWSSEYMAKNVCNGMQSAVEQYTGISMYSET